MSHEQRHHLGLKDIHKFILSARSVRSYQDIFGVDFSSIEQVKWEERICDVGSGLRQEFAKGLRGVVGFDEGLNKPIKRPDLHVVSVDPSFGLPLNEKELKDLGIEYKLSWDFNQYILADESKRLGRFSAKKYYDEVVVAALAPDLPFPSGSFDRIFDNHGAYMYLPEEKDHRWHYQYISVLNELLRPNGMIYIYPLDTVEDFEILIKELPRSGRIDKKNEEKIRQMMDMIYLKSRNRLEQIVTELNLANNVELFDYIDSVGTFGLIDMKRLGMKMRKQ
jgi:hypothetical protein